VLTLKLGMLCSNLGLIVNVYYGLNFRFAITLGKLWATVGSTVELAIL
jgi:hypothetical protein